MAYDFDEDAYYGDMRPTVGPYSDMRPPRPPKPPEPTPTPSPEPWGPLPGAEEQSARIKSGTATLGDVQDVLAAILRKENA